jgi:hypothetical protein
VGGVRVSAGSRAYGSVLPPVDALPVVVIDISPFTGLRGVRSNVAHLRDPRNSADQFARIAQVAHDGPHR